jgi:hypothetical protein
MTDQSEVTTPSGMNAFEYGKWIVKDGWSDKLHLGRRELMEDVLRKGQSMGLVDTNLKVDDTSVQALRMGVTKARREVLGY